MSVADPAPLPLPPSPPPPLHQHRHATTTTTLLSEQIQLPASGRRNTRKKINLTQKQIGGEKFLTRSSLPRSLRLPDLFYHY
ncbi:hypothetical protein E2C01_101498 [Portunus trituberculatus]|uniref:Uncharacterized protein n=1 Tax=Portunus trituberculatus TaxID=210409 RepID=A0A5B7KK75_PORTR|nr:hypothetical protein [Portunus trituberculatus]